MNNSFKEMLTFVGWVILFIAVIFGIGYVSYQYTNIFSPKYEQVRYNTFKESQSYNDGMMRDLQNMQMEYAKADENGKAIIRSTALHRFASYDVEKLPMDLKTFYYQLKNGQ